MRIRELRISYHPTTHTSTSPLKLTTPQAAAALFASFLRTEPVEVFMLACLDAKTKLIAVHTVSRGILDSTLVHPREVFKAAILSNAASIITAHNHPSGDPTPSPDDHKLWDRLNQAAGILGINISDHLVIGETTYWSVHTNSLRSLDD